MPDFGAVDVSALSAVDLTGEYSDTGSVPAFPPLNLVLYAKEGLAWYDRFMGVVLQGEYFAPPSGHKKRSPATSRFQPTAG